MSHPQLFLVPKFSLLLLNSDFQNLILYLLGPPLFECFFLCLFYFLLTLVAFTSFYFLPCSLKCIPDKKFFPFKYIQLFCRV